MWSYDQVLEKFCICDLLMYLKARDGVVFFPGEHAGRRVEEVVKGSGGVVITTKKGDVEHIFVVRKSAYWKKAPLVETAVVS